MSKTGNLAFHIEQCVRWFARSRTVHRTKRRPIHVLFCMVDHYEPGHGRVDTATEKARVDELLERYPVLVQGHRDSDGRVPRRTWFFPPHYHRNNNLPKLVSLCSEGFGEIELHLHHGKHAPDTAENLEATIRQCIEEYSEFGIFGEAGGTRRYGFIHGDSALDNSRGGQFCGVNNEIDVLRRTGCYADFTHPSGPETSPSMANTIFYAKGVDGVAKAYNYGIEARAGVRGDGLLVVQGPAHPSLVPSALGGIRFVGDHVPERIATTPRRVRMWVRTAVQVKGCDQVILVKTSTHGAPHASSVLGADAEVIFTELETRYNDGNHFRLHYVTAREMYNVISAIEAGEAVTTDLLGHVDREVSRPVYDSTGGNVEATRVLRALISKTYHG